MAVAINRVHVGSCDRVLSVASGLPSANNEILDVMSELLT